MTLTVLKLPAAAVPQRIDDEQNNTSSDHGAAARTDDGRAAGIFIERSSCLLHTRAGRDDAGYNLVRSLTGDWRAVGHAPPCSSRRHARSTVRLRRARPGFSRAEGAGGQWTEMFARRKITGDRCDANGLGDIENSVFSAWAFRPVVSDRLTTSGQSSEKPIRSRRVAVSAESRTRPFGIVLYRTR